MSINDIPDLTFAERAEARAFQVGYLQGELKKAVRALGGIIADSDLNHITSLALSNIMNELRMAEAAAESAARHAILRQRKCPVQSELEAAE